MTKLSSPSDDLILSWMPCDLRWCSVFAQDPIVLDLTMQCVFCPWLCQAPWRLVSTVFLLLWTPLQSQKLWFPIFESVMYLCFFFKNLEIWMKWTLKQGTLDSRVCTNGPIVYYDICITYRLQFCSYSCCFISWCTQRCRTTTNKYHRNILCVLMAVFFFLMVNK